MNDGQWGRGGLSCRRHGIGGRPSRSRQVKALQSRWSNAELNARTLKRRNNKQFSSIKELFKSKN
jgi:hypothetical protein